MDTQKIILRSARQDRDDGRAFTRYLDQAAEGFFRFMLGKRFEEIIAKAFLKADHDLSWQHAAFAEHNGSIIGMVSGFTAEQHRRSSLQPLKKAAGGCNPRLKAVTLLCAPLLQIIDTVEDRDYYLQAIAVDPNLRGCGAGSILYDFLKDRARDSGSTRLSLDVSAGNETAVSFYRHRGMTIESQWPKQIPIPGIKIYRMTIGCGK